MTTGICKKMPTFTENNCPNCQELDLKSCENKPRCCFWEPAFRCEAKCKPKKKGANCPLTVSGGSSSCQACQGFFPNPNCTCTYSCIRQNNGGNNGGNGNNKLGIIFSILFGILFFLILGYFYFWKKRNSRLHS